jgi:cellulose synthase/poly-beta-1,6-N-acetylglucosamine synthase-like glycosyltransferase
MAKKNIPISAPRVKKCGGVFVAFSSFFGYVRSHHVSGSTTTSGMVLDILLLSSCLYAAMMLLVAVAAARARYTHDRSLRPTVSIIIAARNEESNIGHCLESMTRLTYPSHLLDIVVVDDRSTDATSAVVSRYVKQNANIRLIGASPETGHLRGKTNAVTQGIEASSG